MNVDIKHIPPVVESWLVTVKYEGASVNISIDHEPSDAEISDLKKRLYSAVMEIDIDQEKMRQEFPIEEPIDPEFFDSLK